MTQLALTLGEIKTRFGGTVLGDDSVVIQSVATVQSGKANQIAFIDNPKYVGYLETTNASVVVVKSGESYDKKSEKTSLLLVENPKYVFSQIVSYFHPQREMLVGVHATACVHETASLGKNVSIGPFCVIEEGVSIGDDVSIEAHGFVGAHSTIGSGTYFHPRVTLYHDTHVGKNCRVHTGVVLGSDGFGFAQNQGQWVKLPQVGRTIIGNQVEIGANTTIDRGTLDDTVIEDGVIMDNLIQIAHNVRIGKGTAVAACVGIAGSCTIGAYCMIGGASVFNGHITIADHCYFIPGSQVANSIKKPGVYSSGIPAKERTVWARNVARFHHLDEMAVKLKDIQRKLNTIESNLEGSTK